MDQSHLTWLSLTIMENGVSLLARARRAPIWACIQRVRSWVRETKWLAQRPVVLLPNMSTLCNATRSGGAVRNLISGRVRFRRWGTRG